MKSYKYYLFDMDGTLIDSIQFIVDAFQLTFEQILGRREADEVSIRQNIGLPLADFLRIYSPDRVDELLPAYLSNYDVLYEQRGIAMFDGIREMLLALRERGAKMAVVTSKRLEPIEQLITAHRLEGLFDTLICREDCVKGKPDPEPAHIAMQRLGAENKSEVLFIGDSIHDLHCAKNAGIDAAICGWTRMDTDVLRAAQPEVWLDAPSDLLG
ncbi:MAG: HAD family hydrolase [Ruminococcaceae bacterium]|nr:HAD family hydrolase [Oscillospiraceae bacterium]